MYCSCQERFDKDGNRFSATEWTHLHDCTYVRKRDELVPKAMQAVLDRHGFNLPGPRFTRLFANEMNKLAREAKLI
jgi:hypothetical protein